MFGHESLPSKIYSYDINMRLMSKEDLQYINTQLWLANHMRNDYVTVRNEEIKDYCVRRKAKFPEYEALENKIAEINEKIKTQCDEIKKQNSTEKKRMTGTLEQKEIILSRKLEENGVVNKAGSKHCSVNNKTSVAWVMATEQEVA